jgi:hypothetical protein
VESTVNETDTCVADDSSEKDGAVKEWFTTACLDVAPSGWDIQDWALFSDDACTTSSGSESHAFYLGCIDTSEYSEEDKGTLIVQSTMTEWTSDGWLVKMYPGVPDCSGTAEQEMTLACSCSPYPGETDKWRTIAGCPTSTATATTTVTATSTAAVADANLASTSASTLITGALSVAFVLSA